MADAHAFLERWSRLKRGAATPEAPPATPPATTRDDASTVSETRSAPAEPPPELPAIETLTKDSDYSLFMQPGVSDAQRNAALRKLWQSDPVFANLDGLLEYGEDFSEPWKVAGAVATVYRVLQGMPDPAEAAANPKEAGEAEAACSMASGAPDCDAADACEASDTSGRSTDHKLD